jgi:hypothetical protein
MRRHVLMILNLPLPGCFKRRDKFFGSKMLVDYIAKEAKQYHYDGDYYKNTLSNIIVV